MKNVAIITIWDMLNYGNRLQNYAVTAICEKKGLNPKTIVTDKNKANTLTSQMKSIWWSALFLLSRGKRRSPEYRSRNFKKFTNKYIPYKNVQAEEEINNYDYLMIGSDQIWNANIVKPTDHVYGQKFDKDKIICMSPSFGVEGFDEDTEKQIGGYLNKMENLNAREYSGAKIIKRLTGKDVPVFIDPTLMLDAGEWEKVEKKPFNIASKKYILKYFLGNESQESIEDAERIAKQGNYDIIKLWDKSNPWHFVTGPSEFVYLIHHADMILTDSFHACVFSILFKRPFWVYSRQGEKMNSRLDTLFELLHLDNRFVHDKDNPFLIDYSNVESALASERDRFNSYIDGIISK